MTQEVRPITIKKLCNKPLILNNRIIWKKDVFKGKVKVVKSVTLQEDVIYESKGAELTVGDVRVLYIKNLLNKTTNSCRTIAKCRSQSGDIHDRTSDELTKLIGQNNYDILFSTLCSVINQDMKIRGILSVLTVPKATKAGSCQTDTVLNIVQNSSRSAETMDMLCQTDESFIALYKKRIGKVRNRARRSQLAPYVIRDTTEPEAKKQKKIIISPSNFENILKETSEAESQNETILPDLGPVFDDDSNNSIGKYSALSIDTTPELLMNPLSILANVDKVTRDESDIKTNTEVKLTNLYKNSKDFMFNGKPLPLPEGLHRIPPEQRVKALLNQARSDWENCMVPDESGHLPIHVAVLNNDLDLLKRQCIVLKIRGISVDLPADNLTPLTMSLYQENVQMTGVLLQNGADPLDSDDQDRNCFHIAAEMPTEHLHILVNHCQHNARKILEDNQELWKPEYCNKSQSELARVLMTHINKLYNSQGYTPLMLAAKVGRYENVKVLVESAPDTVNTTMPSSGNTALYLAVGAACMDSAERGNKSQVVDHFKETIDILVDHGADPNLNNFAGSNVNDLLTEYNNGALSMLIANKLTCRNFCDGQVPPGTTADAFMLIKDKNGKVDFQKLEKPQKSTQRQHNSPKSPRTPKSPNPSKVTKKSSILENVLIKSPVMLIKSETLSGQSAVSPVTTSNVLKNKAIVQNFRLDKPLVLKTVATQNKRKLEITVEPTCKKSNSN